MHFLSLFCFIDYTFNCDTYVIFVDALCDFMVTNLGAFKQPIESTQ